MSKSKTKKVIGSRKPRVSKRKITKERKPCQELAILSPCESFCRMVPNPFYQKEMKIYKNKKTPKD